MLVFTVMDQRRTEFETGYGLEGVLPDAICYRVGMQQLVPYFRSAEYGAGLIAAVNEFKRILEQPDAASEITAIPSD
ncbi:MAG: TPM domain-containing protein, partial [Saprospiraceae bacterium]|nr:TPM domain-containing protein [Saprospiraceae bacterium]